VTGSYAPSTQAPKAEAAALLSSLVPGWGQAHIGRSRLAYPMFVVDLVLLAGLVLMVSRFQAEAVKMLVSPDALIAIMAGNLVLLGYRTFAVASAYRHAPSTAERPIAYALMLAAGALLVLPHLFVGFMAWTQYDLIRSVFAPPVAVDTTTTTLAPTTTVPTSTTTDTTVPSTTTTTSAPTVWNGLDRLNIVLLGADAGAGRDGTRTDTTIVVSIDPATGEIAMISVPRNLSNVPLPEGMGRWDCNCFPDLLTHLYDAAERDPEAFPGPNQPWFNAIKGALGELLGIPIHYYAMVTLDGFVGVVDALGGVTIDVPKTIVDPTYPHENGTVVRVEIPAGRQHLDGHLALAYSRIRRTSDDFARMHRQRCVLGAVADQTSPLGLIMGFPKLAEAIKNNVTTDIPQDRLVDFVDLFPKVSTDRMVSLRIDRSYRVGSAPGRTYYDLDRIFRETQLLIEDPDAAREQFGLGPLDSVCDESYD
jgi:polyisoprenyl-teichoic acid--peptidoglycan teichoic acid transferase